MLNARVVDGIGYVELDRPEVKNAINKALCDALSNLLVEWSARDDLRAVIFSGSGGKAFAAGADIRELKERTHKEAFLAWAQRFYKQIEEFPRPTIAAIEGYALGGGLELALACDIRVASKTAKVGFPEVTLGIFPSAGGTSRLPRIVGPGRARELIFTGRVVSGEEAHRWGLFEFLVEHDAMAEAVRVAQLIAKNAPLAVQVAKVALNASMPQEGAPIEWLGQALLFDSEDKHTRMAAFLDARKSHTSQ
jgi:enoyl-CoA hydratase